jgi:hypothetical protein
MSTAVANPRLGGAKYVSDKRAADFVRRGIAVWEPGRKAIRFTDQADSRRRLAELKQTLREERREFERNRGGIVFWNGSRGCKQMHRPGEVIS